MKEGLVQKSHKLCTHSVKESRISQSKFLTLFIYLSKVLIILRCLLNESRKVALVKNGETPLNLKTVATCIPPGHE